MNKVKVYALFGVLIGLLSSCTHSGGMHFNTVRNVDEMAVLAAEDSTKPVLLYVTDGCGKNDSLFTNVVFADTALGRFANDSMLCLRADAGSEGWSSMEEQYGLVSLPSLLLFAPDGSLIMDIKYLGFLGLDESGDLPCRRGMLRAMKLAIDCLNDDDSTLFSAYNWKQLQMVSIRLDCMLFDRLLENRERLTELYGNDYYILVDYAISSAAVNLVYESEDGNICVPHRREAFYKAVDKLTAAGFPQNGVWYCTDRYRFYGDINIATGTGYYAEALRIADKAFASGIISETEYNQLKYQLVAR